MAIGNKDIIQVLNNVKAPYNVSKLASNMAHKAFDNLPVLKKNVGSILEVGHQSVSLEGSGTIGDVGAVFRRMPYRRDTAFGSGRPF